MSKIKSIIINNPHLHYTEDRKINTIHNINKYIKRGPIIKIAKKENFLIQIKIFYDDK